MLFAMVLKDTRKQINVIYFKAGDLGNERKIEKINI